MSLTVCTLFEGHYHHGVAALASSLKEAGYEGKIFAGYRGPLPDWAGGNNEFAVGPATTIAFVPVTSTLHLTHFKPTFMLDMMCRLTAENSAVAYVDPDIVIRAPWSFFEKWAAESIAVCADVNWQMPRSHPIRREWLRWAGLDGVASELDLYLNAGFVAVPRARAAFLELWRELVSKLATSEIDLTKLRSSDYRFPAPDQDAMNIAAMIHSHQLSAIGPAGMDFIPGPSVMSHAIGTPKPWQKRFVASAISGAAPSRAEKAYWEFANRHIQHHSMGEMLSARTQLKLGSAIGRIVSRR